MDKMRAVALFQTRVTNAFSDAAGRHWGKASGKRKNTKRNDTHLYHVKERFNMP